MIHSRITLDYRRAAELAQQGHSHRWIARRLGINRKALPGIIREIAAESEISSEISAAEITLQPGDLPTKNDDPPGFDPANLRRCRGCGALVYLWPCLSCCLAEEASESTAV